MQKEEKHGKGDGTLYKRGGVWYAEWTVAGVRHKRTTGKTDRAAAERILRGFVAPWRLRDAARKAVRDSAGADDAGLAVPAAVLRAQARELRDEADRRTALPLADVWTAWDGSLYHRPWAESTRRTVAGRIRAFLDWAARERQNLHAARDVDAEAAAAYLSEVRRRATGKTFNDVRALLAQAWDGLARIPGSGVRDNPFRAIERAERRSHSRRELTLEELARVVASTKGEMRTLFAIGIYTGLRLGDAVHLPWHAVDLDRGWIDTTPAKTQRHGTRVRIPVSPVLHRVLEETPERKRRGPIVPALAALYDAHDSGMDLVRKVQAVFRSAGIETSSPGEHRKAVDVGFHSLRHTYVSLCANAGVPLAIVQAIVGHTSVAMTEHYFHAEDAALRGAAAALPDVTGGKALPPPDGLAAFRAAVAALKPEQLAAAARILDEARKAGRRKAR